MEGVSAPDIVKLITEQVFPVILTFRYRPRQKSLTSPRSTARIEFVDGTSRVIPVNEMTVQGVINFIWATGNLFLNLKMVPCFPVVIIL